MSRGDGPADRADRFAGGGGAIRARLLEGFRTARDILRGLFRGRREEAAEIAGPHPWEASYPESHRLFSKKFSKRFSLMAQWWKQYRIARR